MCVVAIFSIVVFVAAGLGEALGFAMMFLSIVFGFLVCLISSIFVLTSGAEPGGSVENERAIRARVEKEMLTDDDNDKTYEPESFFVIAADCPHCQANLKLDKVSWIGPQMFICQDCHGQVEITTSEPKMVAAHDQRETHEPRASLAIPVKCPLCQSSLELHRVKWINDHVLECQICLEIIYATPSEYRLIVKPSPPDIVWPKACVSCGRPEDYDFQTISHEFDGMQYWRVAWKTIDFLLCPDCSAIPNKEFSSRLKRYSVPMILSILVVILLSVNRHVWTRVYEEDFLWYEPTIPWSEPYLRAVFVISVLIAQGCLFLINGLYIIRKDPVRLFVGSKWGLDSSLVFKSEGYAALFKGANPPPATDPSTPVFMDPYYSPRTPFDWCLCFMLLPASLAIAFIFPSLPFALP